MPRWTGNLALRTEVTLASSGTPTRGRVRAFGLPREGSGSVASFSARDGFALDIVASALAAGLINAFIHNPTPEQRQFAAYGVLALEMVVLVAVGGQTLGMRLLSLKVVRLSNPDRVPACSRADPHLRAASHPRLAGFFTATAVACTTSRPAASSSATS